MPIRYDEFRLVVLEDGDTTFTLAEADGAFNVLGNDDANTITGNAFDNILNGAAGADSLNGGGGNDTYVVDDDGDVVTELENGGTDTVRSSVNFSLTGTAAFVENLTLIGIAAINGTGNALANTLTGNTGANILDGAGGDDALFGGTDDDDLLGGDGSDLLDGGTGNDEMTGGAGNDTYVVDSVDDEVTEAAAGGTDTVNASITYSIAAQANLENVILIGSAALNATGNAGNNSLTGNAGVNNLVGGAGNDTLDGGAGADRLDGGANDDTYVIDNAGDVIIDSDGVDTVVSFLSSYTLATGLENMRAGGTGAVNFTGNAAANVLTGNSGANILDGGAGADTMAGGLGNDTYLVDSTFDVVTEAAGGGIDTVRVTSRFSLAASAEVEFLVSGTNAAVRLGGSEFANTIVGGNGRDVLLGFGGNDVLDGGRGLDDLRGGLGKDFFKFDDRPTRSNVDRILDFNVRDDSVMLDNAIFRTLGRGTEANPGKLSSAYFRVGDQALDRNDYLIFNRATDDLFYDADGSGRGAAVKIADFNNVNLTAADIFII
ncbi:calcium-binding protein [Microvirga sp. CF3062]|uniref:calcium-binding protein n=1 Tax=Microvirga sp. CF3062 TaxID=3110182 RepID=UPI002E7613CB|nr:calcium-binding protein [Microvirga sp. CF3062]MEE1658363.1 calcium-binding protein [Microvirga sp. CF3062]